MLSCAGGTIRKGKGRVEASSLVSRRLECMGKDRNMAGFNKGHWLPPELEHSCIARDTRGLFN